MIKKSINNLRRKTIFAGMAAGLILLLTGGVSAMVPPVATSLCAIMPNLCVANYTLTLVVNPVAGGTVAITGGATTGVGGSTKEIKATANSGYVFSGWTFTSSPIYGNLSNTLASSATFTFGQGSTTLTANFSVNLIPQGGVIEPVEYTYTDSYNYPKGVLVYVEAEGDAGGGNATSFKGGFITYTLRVTNQGSVDKIVNLRYVLPSMFDKTKATIVDGTGFTLSSTSNELLWNSYTATPGESSVKFKVKAP